MAKTSRMEIRIDAYTKEELQLLASLMVESGTLTDLVTLTLLKLIDDNKALLKKAKEQYNS